MWVKAQKMQWSPFGLTQQVCVNLLQVSFSEVLLSRR